MRFERNHCDSDQPLLRALRPKFFQSIAIIIQSCINQRNSYGRVYFGPVLDAALPQNLVRFRLEFGPPSKTLMVHPIAYETHEIVRKRACDGADVLSTFYGCVNRGAGRFGSFLDRAPYPRLSVG